MDAKSVGKWLGGIGRGWIVFGAVCIAAFLLLVMWISYFNHDKSLRVQFDNESRANQADFDNMWKTIQQKYQIKGDYEKTFKDGLHEIALGRTGGGMFKSIQESSAGTGISNEIYREMMATIEGKRNQFETHQMVLSDIKAQDDVLISQVPGCLFLFYLKPLELKMVTSAKTDAAFSSGQDNDVQLK